LHKIKYRMTGENLHPRRTKLEVPGWAGEAQPRADGSREFAWHCVPFTEAARYGIEVLYPHANDLRVSTTNGKVVLDGDFGAPPEDGRNWPPFRAFGDHFYTYQLLLDLKVEPGFAIKIEPHPRLYTDPTDSVPIAVPALLRNWWPMIFFMVFKAPPEGRSHIFKQGEPFAQFNVVPDECEFELVEMSDAEAAEREMQSRRIYESRATLAADSQWVSATNTVFDATYRRMHGAARKQKGSEP
jgi:hypothetical protein